MSDIAGIQSPTWREITLTKIPAWVSWWEPLERQPAGYTLVDLSLRGDESFPEAPPRGKGGKHARFSPMPPSRPASLQWGLKPCSNDRNKHKSGHSWIQRIPWQPRQPNDRCGNKATELTCTLIQPPNAVSLLFEITKSWGVVSHENPQDWIVHVSPGFSW